MEQKHILSKETALIAVAIVAFAVVIGQTASIMLMPNEVYAPTTRRGFMCEYRPEAQLSMAYPTQSAIMQQVALKAGETPMMLIHN